MKRSVFITLLVSLLLLALPFGAMAAAPTEITVHVRNQTGAPVDLALTNADGIKTYITLVVGNNNLTLFDGVYDFYAATTCGGQTGVMNLPASLTYVIDCKTGQASVHKLEECQDKGLYIYFYDYVTNKDAYIPWTGYGQKWAGIAPWDNQGEFIGYYLYTAPPFYGWEWGCFDDHTKRFYGF